MIFTSLYGSGCQTLARLYSTSFIDRARIRLGLTPRLKYPKWAMKRAAMRLYLCNTQLPDSDAFLRDMNMPDVFASWFRVTELHVWLTLVRLSQESHEGLFVRRHLVEYLWQDVDKRTRQLGSLVGSVARREGILTLFMEFRSSLLSYDEGLLGDDKALAAALWRSFFSYRCSDPRHLELLVQYVRKQTAYLEGLDSKQLLYSGLMTFLPLHQYQDSGKMKEQLKEIIARF